MAGIEQATGILLGSGRIEANGKVDQLAYCPGSICTNGIFNFLAAYSQSSWGRYNDMITGQTQNLEEAPVNYDPTSGTTLTYVAVILSGLYSIRHSRTNDLPTDWGTFAPNAKDQTTNDPALAFMANALQGDYTNNPKSVCNIYYVGGGSQGNPARDVVYTQNEAVNWTNGYCN